MKTYTYKSVNETTTKIEVSDEWFAVLAEMDREERRNNKTETRRHISLDYLKSRGIEFPAPDSDPLIELIKRENEENLHTAIALLSDKQRELVQKVFFNGMSMTEIAEAEGVDRTAISHRFATIYKKLKNLL